MSNQSHRKRNLILSLIVIIMVVVGVVASLSMQSPRVYTITIFNDQETVNVGGYNPHPFTIPSGASDSSVSVAFTAQGGSDNDIKMYIIDYANFVNYTNNNDFSYLYYSGQIHTASFRVNLPSGDYYLVLDNMFTTSYQKLVSMQMNATYTK
jgi:hypothetical protein